MNELSSDGEVTICSGIVFIGVLLVDGRARFFSNNDIEVFLGVLFQLVFYVNKNERIEELI